MKNHKAPGIDVITAEVLKSGGEPMVAMLYKMFNAVYDTEKPDKNWDQMLVTPSIRKVINKNRKTIELSRYSPSQANGLVEYF